MLFENKEEEIVCAVWFMKKNLNTLISELLLWNIHKQKLLRNEL